MRYGDKLKNGATVAEAYSNVYATWVSAVREEKHHPYVTWQVGPDGESFYGNYFENPEDAHKDFLHRIGAKSCYEEIM